MLSQGPGQFKYFPTVWSGLWYLHIYRPRPSTAASSVNGPIIFINGFTPAPNLNWPWLTIRWLIITFIHVTNWMDIFQQIAPFTHYQCFIINQPNHLQCWLLPESQKKNNSCKKYFVNSPHRLTPAWEGRTGRGWSYQNNPIFRLFKSFFSRILNLSITWEVSLWNNK